MAETLRKFVARAPRYVIQSDDNHIVRFAHKNDHEIFATRFLDVSETGLALIVERDCAPMIGDIIKLEFTVPGTDKPVAWFARVVRLEDYTPRQWWNRNQRISEHDDILIGVKFIELPAAHATAIRKGIQKKVIESAQERRTAALKSLQYFIYDNYGRLLLWLVSFILTFAVLYFLSLPFGNYDAEKGAPWGQRIFNLDF